MKIVKISANFPPRRCGIGDYTRLLCENLVNFKKDIFFYIITSADSKIIEFGYSYERIEVIPAISSWSFAGLPQMRKLIKEISPDIVHIEYNRTVYSRAIAMNFLPYLLKKENPTCKIITTFHDLPGPLKNRDPFFWLTSLSILIYSDRITVTNDIDFNSFTCNLPFLKRKCVLVPVGSNVPKVEGRRAMVRKELNVSDDVLLLSFFGFIREDKCLTELFYAFSELLNARRNLKLLIIGGILNREIFLSLQKLSHKLNLNNMVTWMNYQSHKRVSELLSASDIVILPYKNGIGTNSGAFAACVLHSLPIVTTNAKFMPEVIKDNYNLMLVRPGSTNELTDVLFKITEDPDLRKKLSQNLKELNDYLSWQSISHEIFKLYTGLHRKYQQIVLASIVICTYDRPETVKRLLIELNTQRYGQFEVLVICQGNKEDMEKIKDSIKNIYPIRYYHGERPNLPHARNIGIKEASGEIIIFLDDDAKPCDTLIEAHLANYTDSTVGMVGGRVLEEKYEKPVPDSKIGMARRFDGFAYAGFHKDIKRNVMHVRGLNMSVRKDIALEIGGFDERFEGTAEYEDMDFCLRLLRKGYRIIFDPTAVAEHLALSTGGCRMDTKEESMYWLYRSHSLVFLNNFNKLFYPIVIAEYIVRIILRSILWRNPRIIGSGLRGIRDGLKAHFSKPRKRL